MAVAHLRILTLTALNWWRKVDILVQVFLEVCFCRERQATRDHSMQDDSPVHSDMKERIVLTISQSNGTAVCNMSIASSQYSVICTSCNKYRALYWFQIQSRKPCHTSWSKCVMAVGNSVISARHCLCNQSTGTKGCDGSGIVGTRVQWPSIALQAFTTSSQMMQSASRGPASHAC